MARSISRTIKRVFLKRSVRKKQTQKASKRPTQEDILLDIRRTLKTNEAVKEVATLTPEQANALSTKKRDAFWTVFGQAHSSAVKRLSVHYALRQMGIRKNRQEIRNALEKFIERKWRKDAAGVDKVKRDGILVESFNKVRALLGEKQATKLLAIVTKKMNESVMNLPPFRKAK